MFAAQKSFLRIFYADNAGNFKIAVIVAQVAPTNQMPAESIKYKADRFDTAGTYLFLCYSCTL